MPRTLDRAAAVALLAEEAPPGCFVCALAEGPTVARGEHAALVVPRFQLRPAHVMVVMRRHVTTFAATERAAWLEATDLAWRAARALERVLEPARCYVASLGTAREDVPMSSPHLHLHVIPLQDPDERPREVLTWGRGVLVATDAERADLAARVAPLLDP